MRIYKTMLPSDWTVELLDSVAQRGTGHTPDKERLEYWNGGIRWISLADSGKLDCGLIYKTDKEISEEGLRHSSAVLHPVGSVVLSRDAGVGKSAILAAPMAVSQHFIAWDCSKSKKLHNWFLYYLLQLSKPEFERVAVGSTIKTIGLPYFRKLQIPCPALAEQERIAKVLLDWDEAISTTERLLANSRKQKLALMQRLLLNGSTSRNWRTVQIQKIADRVVRGVENDAKTYPILMISSSSGFVRQDEQYGRYMAGKSVENYVLLNKGEFAYNKGNSKRYEFGCVFPLENHEQGLVPHVYVCFALRKECDPTFYKYLFETDYLHDQLGALVNTGVRNNGLLNIRPADFMGVTVPLPSLENQRRVAAIIGTASDAVVCLQRDLNALKVQKQALMQQLLTGKRRVRLPESASEIAA